MVSWNKLEWNENNTKKLRRLSKALFPVMEQSFGKYECLSITDIGPSFWKQLNIVKPTILCSLTISFQNLVK